MEEADYLVLYFELDLISNLILHLKMQQIVYLILKLIKDLVLIYFISKNFLNLFQDEIIKNDFLILHEMTKTFKRASNDSYLLVSNQIHLQNYCFEE